MATLAGLKTVKINIQQTSDSVKQKTKKSKLDSLLLRLASTLPKYKHTTCTSIDPHTSTEQLSWQNLDFTKVENCANEIYKNLKLENTEWKREGTADREPAALTPALRAAMYDGEIPDAVICGAAQAHIRHAPVVMARVQGDEYCFFRGAVRGDKYYARKVRQRMAEATEVLASDTGTILFITATYSPADFCTDIYEAWQLIREELLKFKRNLKKRYKMEYIDVVESTLRGYPHVHCIIHILNKEFKRFKYKDKWRLDEPDERKFIKDAWTLGNLDIVVAEPEKPEELAKYAAKYVAKGLELEDLNEFKIEKKLPEEKRKSMLTNILPVATKIRSWHSNISLASRRADVEERKRQKRESILDKALQFLADTKWRSWDDLERLLINLTEPCHCKSWLVYKRRDKAWAEGLIGAIQPAISADVKMFRARGSPLGCSGCILTDAIEFLHNVPQGELSGLSAV